MGVPERDGSFGGGVQAEALFAEVVAGVDLGLYIYRAEDVVDAGALKLVYANPASVAATGVELEEIIGQPIRRAFPGLVDTELPAIYLEIALGGEAQSLGEVKYGDGRIREQVFSVRAFPLPERSVGVSFTNVTAQRVAEQRAVQTLEAMSDAFFTLDADWNFTYLNRQAATILRREREELVGKNIWREFPEEVGTALYIAYHRVLAQQVSVRFEQAYEPREAVLEVRAHPITNGLAVYFADVTEERILRGRLRQAQRLESIGQVTASVAHDFNNLLTAIRGYAHLGRSAEEKVKVSRYFDEIESAGAKATELTRQLLAFGREQALAPSELDLNAVLSGLETLLHHLLPVDLTLELDLADDVVPVYADQSQLEQVFLNLVVNARDANDGKPGTIAVTVSDRAPADLIHDMKGDFAWLQVIDTGVGIPEEVRPRIFDPFFTTKPPETGTGLGLATIYGSVTQSGGAIFVDSTVGVGTTMTVALPANRAQTATEGK